MKVEKIFEDIAKNLREKAESKFKERLFKAKNLKELKKYLGKGIITVGWCGDMKCAKDLDETGGIFLTVEGGKKAPCLICGKKGKEIRIAKAY